MSKTKKRGTTIAVAGAVAAVAIGGGVAWAAFAQSATAQNVAGSSAKFGVFTATGNFATGQGANMLPGDKADIVINVNLPSNNTANALIKSVTPTVGGKTVTPAAQADCAGQIDLAQYLPANLVIAKGADAKLILADAVTFRKTMTEACQGISFTTTWDVQVEATNDDASKVSADGVKLTAAPNGSALAPAGDDSAPAGNAVPGQKK
ncbi:MULTISPECIES: hypothetical protein [Catenuloplanes]|uniref:Ribosomally synthesized peptide with SipW-like signal peptide n=1 Tax=Catenuloplanes niger TaxID=587534 RepID=A0AAE3ZRU7_9ACTN|nr:hypothetical protein [Catenuloplanes niger]MDR7323766.1 hypothetical protein [Catenuloplanes niger]